MATVFYATLFQMLVMFLMVLTGFFLTKKRIIPKETVSVLSSLETYVFVPCLILKTFFKYCTFDSLKNEFHLFLYCFSAIFLSIVVSFLLSPLFSKDEYERKIYQYALVFSNFSFLGNSIIPAILGEESLYLYMIYTLPLMILAYSWGVYIIIPKSNTEKNPFSHLINPVFISIILGILGGLFNIKEIIPTFFTKSIENFSACMSPVAMILTGCVIGNYNVFELLKNKKVYVICLLKLIVLPLFFVFFLKLFGADKTTLILTFFAFGTALGLNTIIFPTAYKKDAKIGASMALIAQILSIVTIPLIYTFLKYSPTISP